MAHDPEPNPQKQARESADTDNPTGQARPGNENNTPPSAANARTNAADRNANAARPEPNAEARNTRTAHRPDRADRTAPSTPRAQPTNTTEPEATPDNTSDSTNGTTDREPEKPTTGKPKHRETANGTDTGHLPTQTQQRPSHPTCICLFLG